MWQFKVIRSPTLRPGETRPLKPGANLVGREGGCDIEIADPRISARHCRIDASETAVEITDLQSTNGTFLDGISVLRGTWTPGKPLVVGGTELELIAAAPVSSGATAGAVPVALSDRGFDFSIVSEQRIQDHDDPEATRAGASALARRLKVLQQSVRTLSGAPSVPELLDRMMQLLFEAVECDTGYMLVTDPENPESIRAHLAYDKGRRRENLEERLYSRTLVSKVLESKAGFLFDSEEGGMGLMGAPDQSQSIFQLRIKTALCCPIHSEGRVFGVIYLDSKRNRSKFTGEDLDVSMHVAGIAGMALENAELYRKLRAEAAIRDNLRRFLSPNVAEKIIAERGGGNFHLQSQKTRLSVLFADIRGFTPLSEALSPLTVAQLLNTYFSEMCAIVFRNGGTLDKFIGDCMMVLFNAPVPVPDHENVAVKTAVEMRKRLAQILPEWKRRGLPEIQVGIGINCGEAVVGSLGTDARMEYTAIGDAVNIASRLCGIAKPGQILVSESVFEKTGKTFQTNKIGSTQLKGKSREVLVYEVLENAPG